MPGGKHGQKAVYDDDYDDYDYDDEEFFDEEDEAYQIDRAPAVTGRKEEGASPISRPETSSRKGVIDKEEDELSSLLAQLIPEFGESRKQEDKDTGQQQKNRSNQPASAGGSALARYLTKAPPLHPSGKAQKAGRRDLAERISQEAAQQPLLDTLAYGVQPYRFDEPSPDELVQQAQKSRTSKPSSQKSWLSDLATSSTAGHDPKVPAPLKSTEETETPHSGARNGQGGCSMETDSEGWQKLPLHLEMEMMQQAARGEDGVPSLHAVEKPRDRRWKEENGAPPKTQKGEASLEGQGESVVEEERRPQLSEYVMEPELRAKCQEAAEQERADLGGRTKLHLVVLGHVDAGKSTLMGRLLHELGAVSQKLVHKHRKEAAEMGKASFAWAWLLDERPQERARGVTIDVASANFETPGHSITLLDAPGHRDFVPNMIAGAAQADAAVLLVDGSRGGFESGFEAGSGFGSTGGGQTREHAQLARSLGIEQMAVVVSKLDTCSYSQGRYEEIKAQLLPFLKQCGFRAANLQWLPAVGTANENLVKKPSAPELSSWWSGPTLVEAIDQFRGTERRMSQPLRLPINDVFKGDRGGQSIGGKLEAGAIKVGTAVRVMPSGEEGSIKAIAVAGKRVDLARAGDSADVTLTDIDSGNLGAGAVLCHPRYPVPLVIKVEARIVVLDVPMPLLQGQQVTLHAHAARETGFVSRLVASIDAKTGEASKKRPRVLLKGQSAEIEVTANRPMCLEMYSDCRALGRIVLRDGGQTLAVGIVTKIVDET